MDSDVKTFLKTLPREEMEFVIIKGLAVSPIADSRKFLSRLSRTRQTAAKDEERDF